MAKGIVKTKINSKSTQSTGGGGSGDMTKAVYDPTHVQLRVIFETRQLTISEAQGLIGSADTAYQQYVIIDPTLPAGVQAVIISTIPNAVNSSIIFDEDNALIYLTGIGLKKGNYSVLNNIATVRMIQRFMIEDFAGTLAITPIYDDFPGVTYSIININPGKALYEISSGASNNWIISSNSCIFRSHPYYNFNQEPCIGYGIFTSTNKFNLEGINLILGATQDADGSIPPFSLYADIENTLIFS